jgi:OmcA/MtrC family decaheme c-type cytochrome
LCNLCHSDSTFGQTQATSNLDPDTGETIDMTAMTHRIHMGASLPSVQGGKPYQIIGNQQSVHDYSEITFPFGGTSRTGGHMVDCQGCHGKDAAVQKDKWLNNPTQNACGSCHDNVNFATGEGHVNLPQISDNQCKTCHTPEGEVEFDASIKGAHMLPRFSKAHAGTNILITNVTDGTAGKKPTVTFTIKDNNGNGVPANQLATLRVYIAGPTTDYATYVQEDARQAQCDAQGVCNWTFQREIPADAKGTFAAYIEGYRNTTILPGTAKQVVQRDVTVNPMRYFSVDGSTVQPRKQVVTLEKCNACHGYLAFHGDQRNTIEDCVTCHNPNETDVARRPAGQLPAQTVDFKTMIHRLHTGKELDHEYTIYGFGNVAHDMTAFGYPGLRQNCSACHVNNSQQLPLREGMLQVKDPRGLLDPMGPETAACTSCHSSTFAKSHALANTTRLGESCATCHGPSATYSVDRVHAQ